MIDYRINYDRGTGEFTDLVSAVTDTSYVATGLTSGLEYQFQIEARNAYGYSLLTESLTILCAFVPE